MKPSPGTGHLSKADLEKLLSGKLDADSTARVNKLLEECELSKSAVEGYNTVPGAVADIASLDKTIASKAGMKVAKWMNVVTITLGVALAAGVTYALWPRHNDYVNVPAPLPAEYNTPAVENDAPSQVVLTPQAEHFVNPEAKPAPQQAILSQGKIADTSAAATTPGEVLQPIPVAPPEVLEVKPVVPEKPEASYNASIGFIFDLKVTEFEKYFKKTVTVEELPLGGTPAQFEDERMREAEAKDQPATREEPAENFLKAGLKAFHDGRYGRCIEKMQVLKTADPADPNALFYMGVSYVKLEMYDNAIPLFDAILQAKNNVFHEEARWYKTQALLGKGDTESAKQLLNEIAGKSGFYQQKAKDKLASLK